MSTRTEAESVKTHLQPTQHLSTPPSTQPRAVLPNLACPSRTDNDSSPWVLVVKPTTCTRYEETFVFVNPMAVGPPATVLHQQDQHGTPRLLLCPSRTVRWLRQALVRQTSRLHRRIKVVKLKICNLHH